MATNSKYSSGYSGLDSYLKDAYNYSIKPAVTAASNLGSAAYDFMTSGSSSQSPHANNPDGVVQTKTYPLGSTAGDNYLIPQPTNLGQGEVPGTSIFGPVTNPNPNTNSNLSWNSGADPFNQASNYYSANNSTGVGIDTADDRFKQNADNLAAIAASNSNNTRPTYNPTGGGGGVANTAASSTPVADVLNARQFSQRTPSGSVYAPDMSAYNDSSLFNYTGQGGVPEYTYGQGLPTDGAGYNIWGSPANIANPYFEGQFAKSVGPADAAINMPAIEMPAGVPAIGGGSGTTTANPLDQGKYMGNPNHYNSGQDLSYKQTIDSMGIFGPNNPPPSTQFPSPGGATTPANMGLTERQIAQMSPQQQAYMTQTLADQNRMQQGQISNAASNIFNPNEQINAAGVSSPDGMMTMPTQPTAMQNYMNDSQSASGVTDRTAEIMAYAKANNNMVDGVTIFDEGDPRQIFQDSILNPTKKVEPQPVMGGLDGTPYPFSGMPPERDTFKADEIDISTPFVPEGQEGVDYWQSTTGEFFNMEDDMGTQALGPVDPFAGMPPERGFFKTDEAGIDKPANLSSYEADGNIESTSNNMAALNDSFAAIDAKYAGSTTEVSGKAELNDVIGVIANEFLGMTIEEVALTPDAPAAEPSYRFADEGQDTGENTGPYIGAGTPFDNPYVPPPLEDVVNPSNVAEIMFGIDTAMPQNGVSSADNTMTMPTFREDVLPAPVYTPVPQPVARPQPVYNTPPSAPPSVLSRPTPTPVARPPASAYTWRPSYGGSGGYRF